MARPSFRPAILQYLEAHEGDQVYLERMAAAIGATRKQTQQAVSNLREDLPDIPIRVIVAGNVWVYDRAWRQPDAVKPTRRMFEEIGPTKSGDILIQDQDGAIYRAVEM